jgi:hypothetical protein
VTCGHPLSVQAVEPEFLNPRTAVTLPPPAAVLTIEIVNCVSVHRAGTPDVSPLVGGVEVNGEGATVDGIVLGGDEKAASGAAVLPPQPARMTAVNIARPGLLKRVTGWARSALVTCGPGHVVLAGLGDESVHCKARSPIREDIENYGGTRSR